MFASYHFIIIIPTSYCTYCSGEPREHAHIVPLKGPSPTLLLLSHSVTSRSLQPHGLQHTRLPCPLPSSGACLKPMSIESVMPPISSFVTPYSSCCQSFPASGSFLMSRFFASGGQRIGVSGSASVLPMNIQDLFPLGLTGLIFLLSKGLSRVLEPSPTPQFKSIISLALSFMSNSHIHTLLLEKPQL